MSFEYEQYLSVNFSKPIETLIAFLAMICCGLLLRILGKEMYQKDSPYKTPLQKLAGGLFLAAVFAYLSFLQIRALSLYGVDLYQERNAQPLERCGTIEEIIPSTRRLDVQTYRTTEGTSLGVTMVIDGERFHAMSSAGFEGGEQVQVLYLPNSHCVLEIHETD